MFSHNFLAYYQAMGTKEMFVLQFFQKVVNNLNAVKLFWLKCTANIWIIRTLTYCAITSYIVSYHQTINSIHKHLDFLVCGLHLLYENMELIQSDTKSLAGIASIKIYRQTNRQSGKVRQTETDRERQTDRQTETKTEREKER